MRVAVYILILIVTLVLIGVSFGFQNLNTNSNDFGFENNQKMRGLCWVAGDSVAAHNLEQITEIGSDWISQTPFGWMGAIDDTVVVLNNERAWWGETDKGLGHTTKLAKATGVKTMLKPHIWLRRSDDKWRQDIAMNSEKEWEAWFDSYERWIVHYARLAEEYQMEALCIGTELHQTTVRHPERWRKIIKSVREVYNGQVTYAANWYKEYEDITFWDDLDYIGVQAYFPLSKGDYPSQKEIVQSWKKHKKRLSALSRKFKKKVVFTEVGYKNTADAAHEPWTWPQDMDESVVVSDETQANCYKGLFQSVWQEEWMGGVFIWKWFHTTYAHENYEAYFEAREERRRKRAKERGWKLRSQRVYFSPQRTPAIEVLKDHFSQAD